VYKEEEHRKEICKIMRRLYTRNLISSVGGNVSVIERERGFVLITPSGADKDELEPSDIVKVDLSGKVIGRGKPSSETMNHLEIYNLRPDINAIIHAHPPFSVGIISSGYIPKVITPEYALFLSDLKVVDFAISDKNSNNLSFIGSFKRSNAVMVKNHGLFSIGNSLMECFLRVEILEDVSKMTIAGKLFGDIPTLSTDEIKSIFNKYGRQI
jgi:L-fuculose-phosphate aldolase